jgi:hypothetical protein
MKQTLFLLTFVFLSTVYCQGQVENPLDLVKTIFAKDSFPDLEKHIKGEYNGHPNGTDLPAGVKTDFLLLGQNEKTAVINLTITDSLGHEFDTYLHLEKDDVWKIRAFRALAMTGMIEEIHKELKSMTDSQIDTIIEFSKNDTLGYGMFKSRVEYEYELGKTGLVIASDNELISHFKKNESSFEVIKDSILLEIDTLQIDQEREIRIGEKFKSNYNSLFISSITIGGFQFDNALNFVIGGMIDNTVGYLFVQDKDDLPIMNPSRIIMIREIGNGWYLYKTT